MPFFFPPANNLPVIYSHFYGEIAQPIIPQPSPGTFTIMNIETTGGTVLDPYNILSSASTIDPINDPQFILPSINYNSLNIYVSLEGTYAYQEETIYMGIIEPYSGIWKYAQTLQIPYTAGEGAYKVMVFNVNLSAVSKLNAVEPFKFTLGMNLDISRVGSINPAKQIIITAQ